MNKYTEKIWNIVYLNFKMNKYRINGVKSVYFEHGKNVYLNKIFPSIKIPPSKKVV